MSELIESYPYIYFGELNWCHEHGVMYQRDKSASIQYDNKYFEHYVRLQNSDIANKLNAGRTKITEKYCITLLDIGIGSGEFINKSNLFVFGYDINPVGIRWLRERNLYRDPYASMPDVSGLTFWDSLEHMSNPDVLLNKVQSGMFVFISMPIFDNLLNIRKSKHYKKNEHFLYFSVNGLMKYMSDLNFSIIEISDFETLAGREGILTFVFKKN